MSLPRLSAADARRLGLPVSAGRKGGRRKGVESALVTAILELLRLHGFLAWRVNQIPTPLGNGRFRAFQGLKGIADILALPPASGPWRLLLWAIEVKTAKGRLRPEQRWFLNELGRRGQISFVARSVEGVKAVLCLLGPVPGSCSC